MSQLSRAARLSSSKGLRYAVSLGLLAAFVTLTDWRQLESLRGEIRPLAAAGALLCAGFGYALQAPRWALLLRAHGAPVTQGFAQRATWIGTFYNSFLIGGAGGDAARLYYVCKVTARDRWPQAIAATVVDRLMGLVVLLLLGLALGVSYATDAASQRSAAIAGAALLLGLALVWIRGKRRPGRTTARPTSVTSPAGIRARIAALGWQLREAGERVAATPGAHALAVALSAAIWLLDFIAIWLVARSVGLSLDFLPTCVAACASYAAAVLPISVGGHGVREGALLLTLQALGEVAPGDDRALLLALGAWAVTMLWSLVGGLALLSPPTPSAAEGTAN